MMLALLRAEIRKLWTIWSTYVLLGIMVVIDLAFGFGLALAPGGRHGGSAGIVPHGSSQWFVNVFSVLDGRGSWRWFSGRSSSRASTGIRQRHRRFSPNRVAVGRRRQARDRLLERCCAGSAHHVDRAGPRFRAGGHEGALLYDPAGREPGNVEALCGARHGVYYLASTHDMWHDWARIAPGVVLGTGLFAIYGLGLGALLKNQIVAIVVGLVFTLIVESIVGAIWPTIGEYLPGQAATALEDAARTHFGGGTTQLLPWWGGAGMLLIYGVALAFVGTFTTLRSDIT